MSNDRYRWFAVGDINAFFGLMLDNVAGLILVVSLLAGVFQFPAEFAVQAMVPGTAIGVFVGDLMFFALAFWLAKRTRRSDVTAMPLGLDTPSTFGMVFFVLGPAFIDGKVRLGLDEMEAARFAWHIGIWAIVMSGLFKVVCSPVSGWIRRSVPRAGLLGSLAAIALVLISFLPLLDILKTPLVGLVALAIVLTSLIGRVPLPLRVPGTLGALIVAGGMFYVLRAFGVEGYVASGEHSITPTMFPSMWLEAFEFQWLDRFSEAMKYMPIVLPFAIGTVVGGIDCTESAAAAGDEYPTGTVIFVEAIATLAAGLCGGVVQTTPYIGHPAYKQMGGRSAYTLATALLIGTAGVGGYFVYFYQIIPEAAVFPILIFVGLEITAQSFSATPTRHYAAVALACVPALAFLANSFPSQIFGDPAYSIEGLGDPGLRDKLQTLLILSNGFILTSLLWASALASIIDQRLRRAGGLFLLCGLLTVFGVIHSPVPGSPLYWPWSAEAAMVRQFALGYAVTGLLLVAWSYWLSAIGAPSDSRAEEVESE
ncbi:permease [Rosistilla carotiformis]|uniref:permease n=1 Tax=Rosistilla carotiformis TaxID=2528017 RepID=UPI0028F43A33|nr:permease [Rosistilla carotiformis]